MKVAEAVRTARHRLGQGGVTEPQIESEFLVAVAMGWSRPQLLLHREAEIRPETASMLEQWIQHRAERKPLGYVSGQQPFMDLVFHVNPSVLIPRPETELLVERVQALLENMKTPADVIDVGTGCGNIALCLARHPRAQRVIGIEISEEALDTARKNAAQFDWGGRCEWICGDLLTALDRSAHRPQIVVANLPYVRSDELESLEPELRWEPRLALDGGPDGLQLISRLIEQAEHRLPCDSHLVLEIGADQSLPVTSKLNQTRQWADVTVFKDLASWPRIITAKRTGL